MYQVFDIETSIQRETGASPYDSRNKIYTIIVKSKDTSCRVLNKLDAFDRNFPWDLSKINVIVGLNLKFDLAYVWENENFREFIKHGGKIWDCQYAEYLLTGQQHTFASLKDLSIKYLGKSYKKDWISYCYKRGIGADKILNHSRAKRLQKQYLEYAYGDGVATEGVYLAQIALAKKKGMLPVIGVYQDYLLAQLEEEYNGMSVDRNALDEYHSQLSIESLQMRKRLEEIGNEYWDERLKQFNPGSNEHISALLYGRTFTADVKEPVGHFKNGNVKYGKVPCDVRINAFNEIPNSDQKTAKAGVYKVDEKVYSRFTNSKNSKLREFSELFLKWKKLEKLIGTYCEGNKKALVGDIIHPKYNNCKSETTRLTSSSPNLQNQHPKIKHTFVSRWGNEGTLAEIDFSQLEVVVQAWITQCPNMIRDIHDKVDFHCKRLAYSVGKTYEEVVSLVAESEEWQLKRKAAKTVSFQKAYGAMPPKIAESTGLPESTVIKIFEQEDVEYPEIKAFYEDMFRQVKDSAEIVPELIKIKNKHSDSKEKFTREGEYKHVGYYQAPTGMIFSFNEMGSLTRNGEIYRYFSGPQQQDYPIQGTAALIQAITQAAIFRFLRSLNTDKVFMVNEVHDSKVFDIHDSMLGIIPELITICESVNGLFEEFLEIKFNVPIRAEVKIGKNWQDMKGV